MNDDLRRRLEDAGRRPTPPADPAFAEALEERLRAVAAGLPPAPPPMVPSPLRRTAAGRWLAVGVALAIVATVAVVGPWRAGPDRAPDAGPALAEAVNVAVALADGTVLEDPEGLLLPEGAVVTVGDGGSARVGDTLLGPGDVATVRGGRLEVAHGSPQAVRPSWSPTPMSNATPTPPTSTPATPSPSPAPTPTRTPAPMPASTQRSTSPATIEATPTPTPAILRPRLRARLIDGPRIAVRWSETWSANRYVLLATVSRSGPAPDPVYRRVGRVLGEFVTPPERPVRIRVPDGVVEVRLLVVALREDGSVLRRSRIVTVAVPPPGDTLGSDPSPTPPSSPPASPAPSPSPSPS